MVLLAADPLSGARSSTPTLSRRSLAGTPRSATPTRHATFSNPRACSPQRVSMMSSSAMPKRSSSPAAGGSVQGSRGSTSQRSVRMDQGISSNRPLTPQRPLNPPRGMPQRRAPGTSSALQSTSDAAKQSLMRRLAADAPHLRSTLASHSTLLGPAAHLFEDPQASRAVAVKASAHSQLPTALDAHATGSQLSHLSITTPPRNTSPSSRSASPTTLAQNKSTVAKSTSADGLVEIKVGCIRAPSFTDDKARVLRQKMREAESYHDTMYHSALATRLA